MNWAKAPKMTNKQAKCECGSGYMPTIMEQGRNRWACRQCYGIIATLWPVVPEWAKAR